MELEDATFSSVTISDCAIEKIEGIGSADKLPTVFQNCIFGQFKGAFTVSRISELGLSRAHKTLLAIIKKLFFQPGRGRQAEALLRGAESYWDAEAADKILRYMLRQNLIIKTDGDHGDLFIPQRRHARRMGVLWELQSSSGDELWTMLN